MTLHRHGTAISWGKMGVGLWGKAHLRRPSKILNQTYGFCNIKSVCNVRIVNTINLPKFGSRPKEYIFMMHSDSQFLILPLPTYENYILGCIHKNHNLSLSQEDGVPNINVFKAKIKKEKSKSGKFTLKTGR